MNHKVRARSLVGRGMPPKILVRDRQRELRVDVTDWHRSIAKEVARGLRQAEREAYRHGVSDALDVVGRLPKLLKDFPAMDAGAAALELMSEILDLHKQGPQR